MMVISIIIPAYNKHEMTQECLDSVIRKTQDYEIVLVDNGSEPPLLPIVDGKYVVNRVRNEENLGYPVSVNQGIRASKGEVIILLNNDVIVTQDWADNLVYALAYYDIVGPMTNYCAGMQKVTLPCYTDEKELDEQSVKWSDAHKGETKDVNWVIGFCMAFRRSLWDEIGPFDESLWPCSGEEIIFCLDARKKGYKVGIARDCYVHHFGSQTFNIMNVDYLDVCKKVDSNIASKHGDNFWMNQETKEMGDDKN